MAGQLKTGKHGENFWEKVEIFEKAWRTVEILKKEKRKKESENMKTEKSPKLAPGHVTGFTVFWLFVNEI